MNRTKQELIEKLRADGSLLIIKWIAIGVVLGIIIGSSMGAASVILFETNPDSLSANYSKCIDFDSEGAKQFEEQYGGQDGIKALDFCRKYGKVSEPVASRARTQIIWYGLFGLSIGFIVGLIIGNAKSEKRKRS
jgi:hypothetical protein